MSATECFKLVFSAKIPFQFFKLMLKFLAWMDILHSNQKLNGHFDKNLNFPKLLIIANFGLIRFLMTYLIECRDCNYYFEAKYSVVEKAVEVGKMFEVDAAQHFITT